MFVNFSEETQHILKQAQKEKEELNHPYVGSEHLFLSMLKDSNLKDILKKHGVTYEKFKNKLITLVGIGSKKTKFILYTPMLKRILQNSVFEAREENISKINPDILLITILDEQDGVAYSILRSMRINIDKLYYDVKNKRGNKQSKRKKLLLEEIGINLTKQAKLKKIDPVIGREKEIQSTIEILLRRKKNNPILLGPAGVGKTAIVEGIANLMVSDKCPLYLKNKTIISLNIFSLVSGTKYRGEFEEKMKLIIRELEENEDIILFIDEIHTMVGAGGAEGAIDASNIFKPALARGTIKVIGATTLEEYKKFIETDAALSRRFQKVMVEEPEYNDIIKILTEIKPLYESYHNIKIPNDLIKYIVLLSGKYLTNRFEPDRSIDVLDEVCAKTSMQESYQEKQKRLLTERLEILKKQKLNALSINNFKLASNLKEEENEVLSKLNQIKIYRKTVTKQNVIDVIRSKGNLKLLGIDRKKSFFYNNLEKDLNNVVIGQQDNVNKLVNMLKVKELTDNKKMCSILISGPKASGKSLLANEFLNKLVGNKNVIDIDLSEYKEYHTISKLIGTTAGYLGYDNKNHIFEKVRVNPSSAILIDNFEKACDEAKQLFLKILENGFIQDAAGRKIDFSNTIIIFMHSYEQHNKVGFDRKEKDNQLGLPTKLTDNIYLKIDMKKLNDKEKKEVIINSINNVINSYKSIKVNIPKEYCEYIFNILKEKEKLSFINSFIKKDLEPQIIDALAKDKKYVNIKLKEDECVLL